MAENISVCVRVRPLNDKEEADGVGWSVDPAGQSIRALITRNGGSGSGRGNADESADQAASAANGGGVYAFDRVFDDTWATSQIYEEVCESLVSSVTDGFNGTIFAYGQTSSGKTHTMRGSTALSQVMFGPRT